MFDSISVSVSEAHPSAWARDSTPPIVQNFDSTELGTDQFLKLEGQVTLVPDDQSRTACANPACPIGKR